jgi:hypothetical protein
LELPFVYRSDDDGNVNLVNNLKEGVHLLSEANHLFNGGFSFNKLAEAEDLYAGATSFFRSFKHMGESQPAGLGQDTDHSLYAQEHKMVTMFSGCRDDQTSADASINGTSEGAMSWAFLETMKRIPSPTYLQVRASLILMRIAGSTDIVKALQDTRNSLRQSQYTQVPQLSVGLEMDLSRGLVL